MRITRDQYFMEMAMLVARRSTCLSRQVGAVITDHYHVVSTGYNGPPPEYPHCEWCIRETPGEDLDNCPAIHAEANAIVRAGGKGDTLYCTTQPCVHCVKMILTAGIKRVIYKDSYKSSTIRQSLIRHGNLKETKYDWN